MFKRGYGDMTVEELHEAIDQTIQTLQAVQRKFAMTHATTQTAESYLADKYLLAKNAVERQALYGALIELGEDKCKA